MHVDIVDEASQTGRADVQRCYKLFTVFVHFLQFYYGFLFSSIHSFIYNSIIHIVNKQLNQKQFQHENPIGCAEEEKKKTNEQTQISK